MASFCTKWTLVWLILMNVYGLEMLKMFDLFTDLRKPNNQDDPTAKKCSTVTDSPYANCKFLEENGFCKSHTEDMKLFCPLTCKFCKEEFIALSEPSCEYTQYGCCKDGYSFAQGLNKAACPENCYDDDSHCWFYKKIGFCTQFYKEHMITRCPVTCMFCKPRLLAANVVEECTNDWSHGVCKHLSRKGLCRSLLYKRNMQEKCRQACGFCFNRQAPDLEKLASGCMATESCCWDHVTSKQQGCPECKDTKPKEYCQLYKGECHDVGGLSSVFIRMSCPQTCGMCDTNQCSDSLTYGIFCRSWKEQGHCIHKEKIMRQVCKKTCDFCAP